ncbi:hypothetical protein GGR50DRAFT_696809 [Xylaria sp. CBS 124048]|nr:hypothetical protein GGR50DRAFT_696809 [Xylaria sp. CBS 124048]
MRHPKRYTHNTAELVSAIVVVGIGIGIGVGIDIDILPRVHATTISTFSDSHCGAFLSTIEVADSTGSGPCRDITSRYGSFEIGSLGPDCAVTIYGRDPQDPYCSATNLLLAASNQCYNSTWISFSVDNCAPAESVASSPTTATATATADTALPTGSADRNTATTASVSWPKSESAPRASSADGPNIGAIVGGSVGGLAVIGVLAIYFFGLRPIQKRQRKEEEEEEEIPQELPEPPMSPDAGLAVSSARKEEEEEEEEVRYPVFELSQQNVVEVHGDTVDRHELA